VLSAFDAATFDSVSARRRIAPGLLGQQFGIAEANADELIAAEQPLLARKSCKWTSVVGISDSIDCLNFNCVAGRRQQAARTATARFGHR